MRRAIAPGGRPPRRTVRPRITPNQVYNSHFPIFPLVNSLAPKMVRGASQNLEGLPIFAPNPEGVYCIYFSLSAEVSNTRTPKGQLGLYSQCNRRFGRTHPEIFGQ